MFISLSTDRGWTRILRWTRVSSHCNSFLPGFAVRIECDRARVFLPQLGLPVNSRGGGPRSLTWRVSDWSTSVGCCDCLHVLDPDRLSAARWVAVLFVCSLCVALAVFVGLGPEACTRTDATMTLQLYVTVVRTLRASLSGTFLQTLPDLVTPLKGHSLSPRSCPPTRSAPSERFLY